MSDNLDLSLPDGFSKIVRLFPLPNVVLFPGVVQALHLFEPRYRALMQDALAEDELITMAFLVPDAESESGSPDRPSISDTVCIGKILSHTKLDDGRYNLFLVGSKRAKIITELPTETPYRMAKVEIVADVAGNAKTVASLRTKIVDAFEELVNLRTDWNAEAMGQFISDDLPFGHLVDMICYACGAEPNEQHRVLEASDFEVRGELVLQMLQRQVKSRRQQQDAKQSFPPDFSLN